MNFIYLCRDLQLLCEQSVIVLLSVVFFSTAVSPSSATNSDWLENNRANLEVGADLS